MNKLNDIEKKYVKFIIATNLCYSLQMTVPGIYNGGQGHYQSDIQDGLNIEIFFQRFNYKFDHVMDKHQTKVEKMEAGTIANSQNINIIRSNNTKNMIEYSFQRWLEDNSILLIRESSDYYRKLPQEKKIFYFTKFDSEKELKKYLSFMDLDSYVIRDIEGYKSRFNKNKGSFTTIKI